MQNLTREVAKIVVKVQTWALWAQKNRTFFNTMNELLDVQQKSKVHNAQWFRTVLYMYDTACLRTVFKFSITGRTKNTMMRLLEWHIHGTRTRTTWNFGTIEYIPECPSPGDHFDTSNSKFEESEKILGSRIRYIKVTFGTSCMQTDEKMKAFENCNY